MNKAIKIGKISTSRIELIDISKAWLIISLAFAFVFSGISLTNGKIFGILSTDFFTYFILSLFTAGLGFLLHELGHKFAAQHYGCVAEFRAFDQMLYLALGLAVVIGFIFAAPGAVFISGHITRKENGIVSAAGPLVNFGLAIIFFGLRIAFIDSPAILLDFFSVGWQINLWLGLFNMIPFGNFDGRKIFQWQPAVWGAMVGFGVVFLFYPEIILKIIGM